MARSKAKEAPAQVTGSARVFISWSGPTSRKVAVALRDWLPTVIQALDPWVSSNDIGKGARWRSEIDGQLATAHFGIVCLTRENVDAPWIHFEAGALAKALKGSAPLFTYLVGLQLSDIRGPLAEFQHTLAVKHDTLELLQSMNRTVLDVTGRSLPEKSVELLFEKFWPSLEPTIESAIGEAPNADVRSAEDMLREILDVVRSLDNRVSPTWRYSMGELLDKKHNAQPDTTHQFSFGKYGDYLVRQIQPTQAPILLAFDHGQPPDEPDAPSSPIALALMERLKKKKGD